MRDDDSYNMRPHQLPELFDESRRDSAVFGTKSTWFVESIYKIKETSSVSDCTFKVHLQITAGASALPDVLGHDIRSKLLRFADNKSSTMRQPANNRLGFWILGFGI